MANHAVAARVNGGPVATHRRSPYVWLDTGLVGLFLGVGVAFTPGAGAAHADGGRGDSISDSPGKPGKPHITASRASTTVPRRAAGASRPGGSFTDRQIGRDPSGVGGSGGNGGNGGVGTVFIIGANVRGGALGVGGAGGTGSNPTLNGQRGTPGTAGQPG